MENKYITYELKDGILHASYVDGTILTLDVVKEIVEIRHLYSQGKSYPTLIDIRGLKSSTKEAREYLVTERATSGLKAAAMLVTSSFSRIIGGIFIAFDKPVIPIRIFSNEEKALEWLKQFA